MSEEVSAAPRRATGGRHRRIESVAPSASSAVRWSGVAVLGKQGFQVVFGLLLARIIGPRSYGAVSEATVYVTLTILLLDQGMSASIIQRRVLSVAAPGAAASLNLAMGVVLAGLTWFLAPLMGVFFHNPSLAGILRVLGLGLMIKALSVTPRALLSRELNFTALAAADVGGAAFGAACGIIAAFEGAGAQALLFQTLLGDTVTVAVLLSRARGPVPNLHFGEIRSMLGFSTRIFGTNGLAFLSRNIDNVLVGRYLGTAALSFYGVSYRILTIPVQLLGQSVNRVLFPLFSRASSDRTRIGETLLMSTEMLAITTVPMMTFIACSSRQLVLLGLGEAWLPAAPLIAVLALSGARETIFYVTPALMKAMGRARMFLRFEIFSTSAQVAGIVIGLQVSVLGVAVGLAISGLVVTPVMLAIQRSLTGIALRRQLAAMFPAVHASAWAAGSYLLLARAHLPDIATLLVGFVAFFAVLSVVLRVAHHRSATRVLGRLARVAPASLRRLPVLRARPVHQ